MSSLVQIILVVGTLIVVVPTRDGIVIVADSKTTRRAASGARAGVRAEEKVFALSGLPGHAFFVTGNSPVHFVTDGQGVATIVDARGVVQARLWERGAVTRADFDAVASECARLAARIHKMGAPQALIGRDLFTVVMARAGSGPMPHEVASFVIRLTTTGAEVTNAEWARFAPGSATQILMFGEGRFVGAGLPGWTSGAARCAREFLDSGRRPVRQMNADTAARGAYSIQEAASIAMGGGGTIGPPFRAYVLSQALTELPPVAPCRMAP